MRKCNIAWNECTYIHKEVIPNSNDLLLEIILGEKFTQASAIVNKSVFLKDHIKSKNIDFSMVYQSNGNISEDIRWTNLLTLGVKRALVVAIGLQKFQQVNDFIFELLIYGISLYVIKLF
jgi:hypothetical protein